MNKVLGIIAIVCAVLLVIGVGLVFVGKALGGTSTFDFSIVDGKVVSNTHEMVENTIDTESFDTLETDIENAKVYIQKGSTNQVYYKVDETLEVTVTNENGTLKVVEKAPDNTLFFSSGDNENIIEITVADADLLNINLNSISGSNTIESLGLNGTIHTESGSVTITEAKGSEALEVNSESGSTNISDSDFASLDVEKVSGSTKLNSVDAEDAKLYSVSGSQHIDSCNIGKLNAERESGSIEVNDSVIGDIEARATSGSSKYLNCEIGSYKGETVSGSTTLLIKGEETDYNYKFDITSGSVKINDDKKDDEYEKDNGADKTIDIEATSGSTSINFYQ